jgi:hypothetical protein
LKVSVGCENTVVESCPERTNRIEIAIFIIIV